jgi:hypothetical protein
MVEKVTRERLKKMTDEIIEAITSDEFMSRMAQLRTASLDKRLETAQSLLSVDGLRKAGVNLPDGMRISSRYFEENVGTFEFGNVSVLEELQKVDPGFVTTLRAQKLEIYRNLVTGHSTTTTAACESASGHTVMGTCGGAGAGTVCACGGSC